VAGSSNGYLRAFWLRDPREPPQLTHVVPMVPPEVDRLAALVVRDAFDARVEQATSALLGMLPGSGIRLVRLVASFVRPNVAQRLAYAAGMEIIATDGEVVPTNDLLAVRRFEPDSPLTMWQWHSYGPATHLWALNHSAAASWRQTSSVAESSVTASASTRCPRSNMAGSGTKRSMTNAPSASRTRATLRKQSFCHQG
jgi:hypothetical protein